MEDGADEAVEEEAADEAEVAVMEHESSVNLAGRELQKESSAQEILNGLVAGITPDPVAGLFKTASGECGSPFLRRTDIDEAGERTSFDSY